MQEILQAQGIRNEALGQKAIEVILKLRGLDLSKRPGLSELLDWVGYLEAVQMPVEKLDELPHIGALLKQESDRKRAVEAMERN